mgnify:CR=1 FL=1
MRHLLGSARASGLLTLASALARLDLGSTRFVVISKSGGTVETLTQAVAALAAIKAAGLGSRVHELFLGVTEPAKKGGSNGLRALFDALQARHPGIDTLSMGMSEDYVPAIEEGATMVRIGSALFGARPAKTDL